MKGGANLLFGHNLPKTAWKWRKLDPEGGPKFNYVDPPLQCDLQMSHFLYSSFDSIIYKEAECRIKKTTFSSNPCCRGNSESGGSRPGSSQRPGSDEGLPEIPDPSASAQNNATQNQMEQSQPVSIIPLASASVTGSVILFTSQSPDWEHHLWFFHKYRNYSF